ncbi:MAG TPA: hypothetical protein VKM55_19235 [Candidatus Lokiarchaeia archaeon]|nr:hypothetical protein [Candidatus Lokiarchaeia archaeon]
MSRATFPAMSVITMVGGVPPLKDLLKLIRKCRMNKIIMSKNILHLFELCGCERDFLPLCWCRAIIIGSTSVMNRRDDKP